MKNQFIRTVALGLLLHGSVFAQTPVRFGGAANFSVGSGPDAVAWPISIGTAIWMSQWPTIPAGP